jgi:hypothetical protein
MTVHSTRTSKRVHESVCTRRKSNDALSSMHSRGQVGHGCSLQHSRCYRLEGQVLE